MSRLDAAALATMLACSISGLASVAAAQEASPAPIASPVVAASSIASESPVAVCDPAASPVPDPVVAELDGLVATLETDTNAALERLANWKNFKKWNQAKEPFVRLMTTFPESIAQLDLPPEAAGAAVTLIDQMPWDYDKARAEIDAGVLSAKGLDFSHFKKTQAHIADLRAALLTADSCATSVVDEAVAQEVPFQDCAPADPASLPKGVAEFERLVEGLDADLAALHERALAEGDNKKASNAILDDLVALGQDFARRAGKIKFAKSVRNAANQMVGNFVFETEVAYMRLHNTDLNPPPEELDLPESHDELDSLRADVGYVWACDAGSTSEVAAEDS